MSRCSQVCPADIALSGCYLVFMDYAGGGNLQDMLDLIPGIREREVKAIVSQITWGLLHLHVRGIVHRDIKPSNILLSTSGCIRICDLDTALGRCFLAFNY
jgi:serine/threonine protein kinase